MVPMQMQTVRTRARQPRNHDDEQVVRVKKKKRPERGEAKDSGEAEGKLKKKDNVKGSCNTVMRSIRESHEKEWRHFQYKKRQGRREAKVKMPGHRHSQQKTGPGYQMCA